MKNQFVDFAWNYKRIRLLHYKVPVLTKIAMIHYRIMILPIL